METLIWLLPNETVQAELNTKNRNKQFVASCPLLC